mmetsp:Transcript_36453/g.114269  ORF Transcript_36453/g.114269 Transcript_36453/m.114269 type:complete len:215 (-) Transcript_36453:2023-2667(-)
MSRISDLCIPRNPRRASQLPSGPRNASASSKEARWSRPRRRRRLGLRRPSLRRRRLPRQSLRLCRNATRRRRRRRSRRRSRRWSRRRRSPRLRRRLRQAAPTPWPCPIRPCCKVKGWKHTHRQPRHSCKCNRGCPNGRFETPKPSCGASLPKSRLLASISSLTMLRKASRHSVGVPCMELSLVARQRWPSKWRLSSSIILGRRVSRRSTMCVAR